MTISIEEHEEVKDAATHFTVEVDESATKRQQLGIKSRNISTITRRVFSIAALLGLSYALFDLRAMEYRYENLIWIAWVVMIVITGIDILERKIQSTEQWQATPRLRFCPSEAMVVADEASDSFIHERHRLVQIDASRYVTIIRMGGVAPHQGEKRAYYFYNPDYEHLISHSFGVNTRQYVLRNCWTDTNTEQFIEMYAQVCDVGTVDLLKNRCDHI